MMQFHYPLGPVDRKHRFQAEFRGKDCAEMAFGLYHPDGKTIFIR